jgi:hypothetical protein
MITTRAVPALLPAHHRRVARTDLTRKTLPTPCLGQGALIGYDAYLAGEGEGGRFVPPEAIAAAAPVAESIAGSDWSAILADLHGLRQVKFP